MLGTSVHLFNNCRFLTHVLDGNGHTRASSLEVPEFAENLPISAGAEDNTTKQILHGRAPADHVQEAYLPHHRAVMHPSLHTSHLNTHPAMGSLLQKESSGGQETSPGEAHHQLLKVFQPAWPRELTAPWAFLSISRQVGKVGGRRHIWIMT